MKKRIGKPEVKDVLTEVVSVGEFSELEGWDKDVAIGLAKFLSGAKEMQAKHTSCVFLAWQELSSKERALLEEHIGKHALAMMGIVFSAFLGKEREIKEALEGKGGLLDFLKFLADKGKGKIIDSDSLPPEVKRSLDKIIRKKIEED